MERKNGGFTLIELLIAITVLSIMAGELLQAFVVSRRFNETARVDERVQDIARKTMEEIKGFPFGELERLSGEAEEKKEKPPLQMTEGLEADEAGEKPDETIISVAGSDYHFREREDGKWELTSRYQKNGRPAGTGKADYLVQAVVNREIYSDADSQTVYSVNQFEMPNIADVSSFQNIVMEPEAASREEELLSEELLLKVNPQEEDGEENEDTSGVAEDENGASGDEDDEVTFAKGDIKRYLYADVKEENEKVTVKLTLSYTVADSPKASDSTKSGQDLTVEKGILNVTKKLAVDEKTKTVMNRIYLFLPSEPEYKKLYISGGAEEEKQFEIYVISHQTTFTKNDIVVSSAGNPNEMSGVGEDAWYRLYTNLENEQPVSFSSAEDRLYQVTVTVYQALYPENGENAGPEPGEALLTLDSTKRK